MPANLLRIMALVFLSRTDVPFAYRPVRRREP
jgi:hypothetical protein